MALADDLTCVIFTSPIPSNPSDWVLDNVYQSVRNQLPDCRILILADGVDGGGEPREYEQFKYKTSLRGREMMEFVGWHHETLMFKEALALAIRTPLVLVVEHDWGFRDLPIDWEGICAAVLDPAVPIEFVNIRQAEFGEWEQGHFGETINTHGVNLLKTNWHQCPNHVASCHWYRQVLRGVTLPQMLEHGEVGHALVHGDFIKDMASYIPDGPIGRLYHLNGRGAVEPYIVGGMFIPKDSR